MKKNKIKLKKITADKRKKTEKIKKRKEKKRKEKNRKEKKRKEKKRKEKKRKEKKRKGKKRKEKKRKKPKKKKKQVREKRKGFWSIWAKGLKLVWNLSKPSAYVSSWVPWYKLHWSLDTSLSLLGCKHRVFVKHLSVSLHKVFYFCMLQGLKAVLVPFLVCCSWRCASFFAVFWDPGAGVLGFSHLK